MLRSMSAPNQSRLSSARWTSLLDTKLVTHY